MSEPRPLLVFHVGAQKAGSSLLQGTLRSSRRELAVHGLTYVDKREINETPFFLRFRQHGWLARKDSLPGQRVCHDAAAASLLTLVERSATSRILISHEGLLGAADLPRTKAIYPNAEKALEYLRTAVGAASLRILLCIRNQADLVESWYVQRVMSGSSTSFEAYFGALNWDALCWRALIDRMSRVVDRRQILVRPFELTRHGGERFVRAVLDAAGVSSEVRLEIPDDPVTANRSFSDNALRIALYAYGLLEARQDRHLLSKFLRGHFSNARFARARLLSPEARSALLRVHAAGNERVLSEFAPGALERVRSSYFPD